MRACIARVFRHRLETSAIFALANLPNERPFQKEARSTKPSVHRNVTETDNKYLDRHARNRFEWRLHFGWAFLTDNKPSRVLAIIAGFFLPQRSLSIFPLDKFTRSAFSNCRSPKSSVCTKSAPDDWSQPSLAWIFSLAIFFLGLSATIFGRWVERVGPRKTMFTAALCFGSGFVISAFGVWWHHLWINLSRLRRDWRLRGLGLGYISPVSTLVKWFPDRPGMATGMAIMGFGGGAFIGSNLSLLLMDHFKSATSEGVGETF